MNGENERANIPPCLSIKHRREVKAEIREGRFFDKKKELPPVRFSKFAEIYLESHSHGDVRS